MLELIFFSILSILIITPCGFIFYKHQHNIIHLSNQLIYGIILISFITLLINFFLPLNSYINSLILILPILIIIRNLKKYLSINFLKFVILNSIIIFLLIAKSNIYRPDAILYHLPYTGVLNNEKIIFGLSNIHFRFAHISIIQYFSAFFNNFIFGVQGIVLGIAIVSSSIIINFISHCIIYIKKRKFNFHFFYLLSVLIFIAYKMNRYSEYGNDAPTHFLFFFLISELIQFVYKEEKLFNSNYFLLSVFIVLNKITMAFAIFLPFIFLKRKNLLIQIIKPKNFFPIIFLFLWLCKNIIVSGCVIYPVGKLCFEKLEWSNIYEANLVAQENEAWTKSWPDFENTKNYSQSEFSSNFNWLSTWSKTHLIKITEILLPYLIFLTIIYLIILLKYKEKDIHKENFKNKQKIYLIILMILFTLVWFLKVPVYRYGYSYFVSGISLGFAYFCTNKILIKDTSNKLFNSLLIVLISVFLIKNLARIINPENREKNYFPKINFINNYGIKKIELENIFYYESNSMCGYNDFICTHYRGKILKTKKYLKYYTMVISN